MGFVCHIGAKISSYKGMPVSIVLSIQFVLQVSGNLLDCMHLLEGVLCDVENFLFHLWADVLSLDHRLLVSCLGHKFQI
jgi:hypothetical protein